MFVVRLSTALIPICKIDDHELKVSNNGYRFTIFIHTGALNLKQYNIKHQIKCNFISFALLQAMLFRLPWKLWRYMEGGKMEEFGLEAKRHIIGPEEEETLAHQYATAFHSVLHRNNLYFAQV